MSDTPRAYTTPQACDLLMVGRSTLYYWRATGELQSVQYKPGGRHMWLAGPVNELAAKLAPPAPRARAKQAKKRTGKADDWRLRSA